MFLKYVGIDGNDIAHSQARQLFHNIAAQTTTAQYRDPAAKKRSWFSIEIVRRLRW